MARKAGAGFRPFTHTIVAAGLFAAVETLSGDRTVQLSDAQVLQLDPGGSARDVTLPDDPPDGLWYMIVNRADAAENLVVKDAAGSTVATVSQDERAIVGYTGSAWVHAGIESIALS